jgi:hypothetical protein
MEYSADLLDLIGLDVGSPDYLAPFLSLVSDVSSKLHRRPRHHRAAQISEPLLQFRVGESRIDFPVELVDDFGGRVLGNTSAIPGARLKARHELAHGWDFWQRLRTRCSSHCECA